MALIKREKLDELLRVYFDLERTIKSLRATYEKDSELIQIDLKKLIRQLSLSKKRIERKIGNTLLIEKEEIAKRLKSLVSHRTRADRASRSLPKH